MRWWLGAWMMVGALGCARMPKTPPYQPHAHTGERYCGELRDAATTVSSSERMAGIALITIAGAGMIGSGVVTVYNGIQDQPTTALAITSGVLALLPITLVPWGGVLLSRADEAEALAVVSSSAMTEQQDREAYRRCTLAKASWVGSRAGATALARAALEDDEADEDDDAPDGDAPDDDAPPGDAASEPLDEVDSKKLRLVQELLESGRVEEARQLMESDVESIED